MFPTGGLFTHGSRRPHRRSGLEQCSLCNVYWALGIRPHFGDEAWTSPRRAPPLYPAGVTLSPDVTPESVLARVDTSAGCSIRDSFSAPSLGTQGFSVLREAEWIVRWPNGPGSRRDAGVGLARRDVADARELARWEQAWRLARLSSCHLRALPGPADRGLRIRFGAARRCRTGVRARWLVPSVAPRRRAALCSSLLASSHVGAARCDLDRFGESFDFVG